MSGERTSGPWWRVRPEELAARYDFDPDRLMDDIYPEDLPDWQLVLAFDALEVCQDRQGGR